MDNINVVKTPVEIFLGNSKWKEILLKDETKQLTGAFKIRGVLNKLTKMNLDNYDTIITASTGNHGQAVALCANYFKKKCVIVIPQSTPMCKITKISKYNPTIISRGLNNYEECQKFAQNIALKESVLYIPSFDDYDIIEGHKSLFHEIVWSNIDYCFCPIGGGGLVSAGIEVLKNTNTNIIGVEIEGMDVMNQSLIGEKKKNLHINKDFDCCAEGILVNEVGDKNFKIAQQNNLKICTVSEIEIKNAIKMLNRYNNIKAEGAGAAALACAIKYELKDKRCICIISGGNIDDNKYKEIIND